jgi:hypothetical protein
VLNAVCMWHCVVRPCAANRAQGAGGDCAVHSMWQLHQAALGA